jgi:hypothetical protein
VTLTEDQIKAVVETAAKFRNTRGSDGQDEFAEFVETLDDNAISDDAFEENEDFICDLFDAVFA